MSGEKSTSVDNAVKEIQQLDTSDPNTTFSTQEGPCRYNTGEDRAIRDAKHEKIVESIKRR